MSDTAATTPTEPVDSVKEDLFDVLQTEAAVDELDIRAHDDGFAYVQAPNGNTAELVSVNNEVQAREVTPHVVNFDNRDEIDDIFGGSILAE